MRKQINVELGARMKAKRQQRGYTREQFAELISRSVRFVANYELGDSGVSLETLKKICVILGTSSDYLLFGYPERDFSDITEYLVHLDDDHFNYISAMIKAYVESLNKSGEKNHA